MRHSLASLVAPALFVGGLASCSSSSTDGEPQIPYAPVNLALDLTNQQYRALRLDNGVVTLPVQGPAGTGGAKGVLIVRQNASTYLAFERNCPYHPYDACSLVSLDRSSRLFLRDSCCDSRFSFAGQVIGGPAVRPLRQYATSLQGTQLTVVN
ncbi:hypothetical protein ACFQ48_05895 [Hymenobacter caeli]|uniref:Rieske domain-containing protein n=1 Tax=Hymenobacter caeli TaxID=2735894 RepID=A0ABX2FN49_9BACT|nr:hypothetical protein [Hymenobacter caeli]NRT18586.1 hypothetical protein [Hymenobacter caeli]